MSKSNFRWDGRLVQFIELSFDLFLVFFGFITVLLIQGDISLNITIGDSIDLLRDLVLSNGLIIISAFIFFRVYKTSLTKNDYVSVMFKIFISLLLSALTAIVIAFFIPNFNFDLWTFIYAFGYQILYLAIFKYFLFLILKKFHSKISMIVGPKEEAISLANKILMDKSNYVDLKFIYTEKEKVINEDIYKYLDQVDYIYLTQSLYEPNKNNILSYCLEKKKIAYLVPKIYEITILNSRLEQIGDVIAFEMGTLNLSLEQRIVKRLFDIIVSTIGLLVSFPILLFIAFIIKIYDRGPIFFRQERLTANNKKFKILKFRSMIPNAEKDTGPVQATEKDPRITPIGKFIRKTRLDELPQLWNVLVGDMSIVGPRALRVEEVVEFEKKDTNFRYRLNVKSGVTGLAQTLGTYTTNYVDKLRFDLLYIQDYSFLNDLKIILYTMKVIFDVNSSKGISRNQLNISKDKII